MNKKINRPSWILLHHSGGTKQNSLADTSSHTLEIINNWHKQEGYPISTMGFHVGYHYIVEKSGKIKQARALNEIGIHCLGMNSKSIGICMSGNFDRPTYLKNHKPTFEQIKSLEILIDEITDRFNIDIRRIVPHRKFSFWKTCYGKNLPDDWGQNLFRRVLNKKIGLYNQLIMLYIKIGKIIFTEEK